MKTTFIATGLGLALAVGAQATMVTADWYSGAIGVTLADNSPAGATFNTTGGTWTGGSRSGVIDTASGSVSVLLNISGGYNNDLYGYLVYNDGGSTKTEILLNRVSGGASGFGSGAGTSSFSTLQSAGMTLVDTASTGVHAGVAAAGGSYRPDSTATLTGTFGGLNAGGTWTLFLADMAVGDQSTLVNWGLSINVVPEPSVWALGIFGVLLLAAGMAGKMRMITARLAVWWREINRWVDAV